MHAPNHQLTLRQWMQRRPRCRKLTYELSERKLYARISLRKQINGKVAFGCVMDLDVLTRYAHGWRARLSLQVRSMRDAARAPR